MAKCKGEQSKLPAYSLEASPVMEKHDPREHFIRSYNSSRETEWQCTFTNELCTEQLKQTKVLLIKKVLS